MVCIDPQAHKLGACSHRKLRCSSEAAEAQCIMAAFHALHLHYSTKSWNLHVVLPLQNVENISEGKSYPSPLPTATQCPLNHYERRCPLIAKSWGSSAGSRSWCKPAFRLKGFRKCFLKCFPSSQGMVLVMELRKITMPRGSGIYNYASSYVQHSDSVIL